MARVVPANKNPVLKQMNTGDRNTKGRPILKGPRGGLYVIGPSGAKYRDFTKATAPAAPRVAAPPALSVLNLAKAHIIYFGIPL